MKTSRRGFMKGLAATCAVGSLPAGALAMQDNEPAVSGLREITYSTCEMCSFRCPIKVHTKNGRVFIEGNQNVAGQRNRVCARGGSGYSQLLDPKRIVKPMKRSGPRGAGKWEVISWETAYTEIADKMKEIAAKYGAESFAFTAKSGATTPHFFQLAKCFGSPNIFTHVSTCPGGRYVTADILMGFNPGTDVGNTKYLIHFGHNLYEGIEVADTFNFMNMQAKGGKVVSFDPRLSVPSSKADEYFLIKPGTDGAVALAMCNVLIEENLYDKAFIDKYVYDFDMFAGAVASITPEFAEGHSGVPAADIRRIAREFAAAAPCAIVSPGHRTTYSLEEFDLRRAMFALNFLIGNYEKRGGLITGKGPGAYNQMAGEQVMPDFPGMSVADDPWDPPARPRIDAVNPMYRYIAKGGGIYQTVFDAALTGEPYPIKGWLMHRTNPLQTVAELPKMVKAAEGMELIVTCDIYMTESASYADYFLPECTYLERGEDIAVNPGLSPSVNMRQPAVEIIGDTKPGWLLWKELAEHLGLGEYYYWADMEERQFIETDEHEEIYKSLKEAGALSYGIPVYLREPENAAEFVKKYPNAASNLSADGDFSNYIVFGTASGKIELCPELLDDIAPGYRLPRFQNLPLRDNEEQFFFIQGKVAVHTNAGTASVPNLSYLMPENPLWIHTEVARKLGIETGDMVEIKSSVGTEKGKAVVTPGIRPDTVFTYMAGSGRKTGDLSSPAAANGISCANLIPMKINDITGMTVNVCGVSISKA